MTRSVLEPRSDRLEYRRVSPADADVLQRLARDAHVRRYLLDDVVVHDGWAAAEIERAEALLGRTGLGLYLVRERAEPGGVPIGFCGFRVFERHGPEPELLYALLEPWTGRGYATEAAGACVDVACALGRAGVSAAVDEENAASFRVLEKAGFRRMPRRAGALGETVFFRLELGAGDRPG